METLVVISQQDQFHTRTRARNHHHSRGFRDINCRTFQSASGGLLPSPPSLPNACSPPITKQLLPNSPKTPCVTSKKHDQNSKNTKRITKSSSVPINVKSGNFRDSLNGDNFFYSELWAGPAYSNSPPPSSLPIPKFSIKPKRTVSLELPSVTGEIDLTHFAKSAPPSPTREHHKGFRRDVFDGEDEFATKTLRRILNLDE
ncbi:uncharacterized protein LOC143580483 [Bidens hawaiensis]|uniref:uncharacterized protein LOC143580483 n=1 Tax=Bidens hawaiensis TaxID=980011 RepID=UPI00404ACB91